MSRLARVILAASFLALGLSAPTADAATPGCQQVLLLFARGSGQGLSAVNATTFFNNVRANINPGVSVATLELGDLDANGNVEFGDWPAAGMKDWVEYDKWFNLDGYRKSVQLGVTQLSRFLNDRASICPTETVILGGYSQGAHVVGDALFGLSAPASSNVGFVALFGDPRFNHGPRTGLFSRGAPWVRGNAEWYVTGGILGAREPYLPDAFTHKVGSWCDKQDAICTGKLSRLKDNAHSEYPASEVFEAANEIALRLKDLRPAEASSYFVIPLPVSVQPTTKLDLVFVFDTTGSMGDDIASAKAAAASLTNSMFALSSDTRVGLVEYKDHGDFFVSRTVQLLTSDRNPFTTGLNSLFASGGGDTPEAVFSGLMQAFNHQPWRNGATKIAILIGDAPAKNPEPVTGYTLEAVAQRAFEIDPVNVYPVLTGSSLSARSSFSAIAAATDGLLFSLGEDEGLAGALHEALDRIAFEPVGNADGPYFAAPGEEIRFTGSSSFDADSRIVEWAWDFDNDGTFDRIGDSPVAFHTYAAPYEGLAVLRVTSADGGSSIATAPVTVAPGLHVPAPPGPPLNVHADPGPNAGEVLLTWDAPASAGDGMLAGFRITDADGSVVALTDPAARSVVVGGQPVTKSLTFGIEAGNDFGFGGPAASNAVTLGNRSPECSAVTASPASLWPPNGKFVEVSLGGAWDPDRDAVSTVVTTVVQNEPTEGEADAILKPSPSPQVMLRAQRSGSGGGRTYRVSFVVTDQRGASCVGAVGVTVAHSKGRKAKIPGSALIYDSLVP